MNTYIVMFTDVGNCDIDSIEVEAADFIGAIEMAYDEIGEDMNPAEVFRVTAEIIS